ncbi:hypothetical protein [Clostridium sp. C2-6-12]|uniref:hypothetical protein n=1 Tax=Clostridium sp. C2-6-12 TaxID=2698832 RepID=UPI00136C940D|nr:hypothetical protein [Clostridium sp. C2-6-12]
MLKTIVEKIRKVLKVKFDNAKFQEKIIKHPDYILKAREVWNMINEDLGISDKIENTIAPKIEKFEKIIIGKFPELTKEDVIELRNNIIEELNHGKEKVLNQVGNLKQSEIFNSKLKEENEKLKAELDKLHDINNSLYKDEILDETSKILEENHVNRKI